MEYNPIEPHQPITGSDSERHHFTNLLSDEVLQVVKTQAQEIEQECATLAVVCCRG